MSKAEYFSEVMHTLYYEKEIEKISDLRILYGKSVVATKNHETSRLDQFVSLTFDDLSEVLITKHEHNKIRGW